MDTLLNIMKSVNVFDVLIIAFAVLGLLFGLIGKASKKIGTLIATVLGIVIAYFTCGLVTDNIMTITINGQSVNEFVGTMAEPMVSGFGLAIADILPLVGGIVKMIVFWVLSFVAIIVMDIIVGIIVAIAAKNSGKAIKTIGIPGALKGALLAILLIFPVLSLAPASNAISLAGDNEILTVVQSQIENSKAVQWSSEIFKGGKFEVFKYKVDDTTDGYLYSDISSLGKAASLAGGLLSSDDPLTALSSMSSEEIGELFSSIDDSPVIGNLLTGVMSSMLEVPAEALEDIVWADEAENIVVIMDTLGGVLGGDEQEQEQAMQDLATMFTSEEPEQVEKREELLEALINSNLTVALIQSPMVEEMVGGAMGELVPEEAKESLTSKIDELCGDNTERADLFKELLGLVPQGE